MAKGVNVSYMTLRRFQGQSILITGGAGGIGRQIARQFAEQGGKVGILDSNLNAIESIVAEIVASGAVAAGEHVDVRDSIAVERAINKLADTLDCASIIFFIEVYEALPFKWKLKSSKFLIFKFL